MIQAAKNEANTGLGRLGFKMLVRGGELLHVHKELLDEIFTELDLNELGVLSFTEIWYTSWFRLFRFASTCLFIPYLWSDNTLIPHGYTH